MYGGANPNAKTLLLFSCYFELGQKNVILCALAFLAYTQHRKNSGIFSIKICGSVKIAPNHSSAGIQDAQRSGIFLIRKTSFNVFFHLFLSLSISSKPQILAILIPFPDHRKKKGKIKAKQNTRGIARNEERNLISMFL